MKTLRDPKKPNGIIIAYVFFSVLLHLIVTLPFKSLQCSHKQVSDTLCPALYDCEFVCEHLRGSGAAAPKGTKSCRTQGDFRSSCLKKWMRCDRELTEGLQEPKLRSKKAEIRPENANRKLGRADLRLKRAGLRLER